LFLGLLFLLLAALGGCVGDQGPMAILIAPVVSGPAPLSVSFDLSHSVNDTGGGMVFRLDFGDGSAPATGSDVDVILHHTYSVSGTYTARLTVTDAQGRQAATTLGVTADASGPPVGIITGTTAPDFTAQTIDGTSFTLSQTRGKVVLLEFWGDWCTPCRESMPHLQTLYSDYKDQGLVVVTVSTDAKEKDAADFLEANGYTDFINLWAPGGKSDSPITTLYGVNSMLVGIPRTFVLDRQGVIRYVGHPDALDPQLLGSLL
jgi:peroxiredoxin